MKEHDLSRQKRPCLNGSMVCASRHKADKPLRTGNACPTYEGVVFWKVDLLKVKLKPEDPSIICIFTFIIKTAIKH